MGLTNSDISATLKYLKGKIKEPQSKYSGRGISELGYLEWPGCEVSIFRIAYHRQLLDKG